MKKITFIQDNSSFAITNEEKIITMFKKYRKKQPLSLFYISYYTGISSGGHLTQSIRNLVKDGYLKKDDCPHCNGASVYYLVK